MPFVSQRTLLFLAVSGLSFSLALMGDIHAEEKAGDHAHHADHSQDPASRDHSGHEGHEMEPWMYDELRERVDVYRTRPMPRST